MRFNSDAFILSTVALLSLLITPVVIAEGDPITITYPTAGSTFNVLQQLPVVWTVNDLNQGDVPVSIGLVLVDSENPNEPKSPNELQNGVSILSGHSDGDIMIPNFLDGDAYLNVSAK
ncbi:hypothetical protein BGY98DRAFT_421824 [Russula aff. rugulosa BPL654]|nr:hypothetical protein BGY98DRAFT_421824 [Russula aff. rugulosa BPL654]